MSAGQSNHPMVPAARLKARGPSVDRSLQFGSILVGLPVCLYAAKDEDEDDTRNFGMTTAL